MAMAIALGGFDQTRDLALGEIATLNCEVFDGWCAGIGCLFCHEKSPSSQYHWKDNGPFLHKCQRVFSKGWKEKDKNQTCFLSRSFFFFEISFLKSGPVHTPLHPVIGGRVPVRVSAVLSMGPRIQTGYLS